jgi:hypothetical protein
MLKLRVDLADVRRTGPKSQPVEIEPDGTFVTAVPFPGLYQLRSISESWRIGSIAARGGRAINELISVDETGATQVVVTATGGALARVTGALRTKEGKPVASGAIYIFPADRCRFSEGWDPTFSKPFPPRFLPA